jgi:hypothetical protein
MLGLDYGKIVNREVALIFVPTMAGLSGVK